MRTMVAVVVALVLVVVGGATLLGSPTAPSAAAVAEAEPTTAPVRPPLREHVVAARDAVAADRTARADRAAAAVEAARVEAKARWDAGDVPLTPGRTAVAIGLAVLMVRASLRRQRT